MSGAPSTPQPPPQAVPEPIDMVLHCPACGKQHIDAPDAYPELRNICDKPWTNPPHRSHLCGDCGHIWRPADVPTNGVQAVKTTGNADSSINASPQAAGGERVSQLSIAGVGLKHFGNPIPQAWYSAVAELMAAAQPAGETDALLREIGQQMVNMTTCLRGPEEWLNIPEIWRLCMVERDHARSERGRLMDLLTAIHSCIYPQITTVDGRAYQFAARDPHVFLQALSDQIRAIPDAVAGAKP